MAKNIPDQVNPLTLEHRALLQKIVANGKLTREAIAKMQAIGLPINDADKQLDGIMSTAQRILEVYFGEKN